MRLPFFAMLLLPAGLLGAACQPSSPEPGPSSCNALAVVGAETASLLTEPVHNLVLAPAGGESAELLVGYLRGSDYFDAGPAHVARFADPFLAWPPEKIDDDALSGNVAGFALQAADGSPALMTDGKTLVEGAGSSAKTTDVIPVESFKYYFRSLGDRWLVGGVVGTGGDTGYTLTTVVPGQQIAEPVPFACPQMYLSASMARLPASAGFLVAFSVPTSDTPDCVAGAPATRIALERHLVPTSGAQTTHASGARIDVGDTISRLILEEATFGAWLVYGADGTGGAPAPLSVQRIDADGALIGAPIVLNPSGGRIRAGELAIESIGEDLAIAWRDQADPTVIHIQTVHPDGSVGAPAAIPVSSIEDVQWITLHGDPLRRGLVVGWETRPLGGGSITASMNRVDCRE